MFSFLSRHASRLRLICVSVLSLGIVAACGGSGGSASEAAMSLDPAPVTSADNSNAPTTFIKSGVITGFGSIIVSGSLILTDDASTYTNGIESKGVQGLRVGMKVSVLASKDDDDEVSAQDIYYDSDIEGTITSVDHANQQLFIQGIQVDFDDLTHFIGTTSRSLSVGDAVEVSGRLQASGILLATYVEIDSLNQDPLSVHLTGLVSNLSEGAKRFVIGRVTVDYADAIVNTEIAENLILRIKGQMVEGVLQASSLEQVASHDLFASAEDGESDHDYAEIEGFVTNYDPSLSMISIEGSDFTLAANVTIDSRDGLVTLGDFVEIYLDRATNQVTFIEVKNQKHDVDGRIKGQIEAIDAGLQSITVQSERYRFYENTRFENDDNQYFNFESLNINDWVEISFIEVDGENFIQRIEYEDDREYSEESELKGFVSAIDIPKRQLTIHGVLVQLSDATRYLIEDQSLSETEFFDYLDNLTTRIKVEVEGQYDETAVFHARFVEYEASERASTTTDDQQNDDALDDDSEHANDEANDDIEGQHEHQDEDRGYFKLEGRVSEIISSSAFVISSKEIRIDNATRFEGNDQTLSLESFIERLEVGLRLEVEGYWVDGTYVLATEIELEND